MAEIKTQKYFRHSTVEIDEVIGAVMKYELANERDERQRLKKATFNGHQVNVKSLRLRTFALKGTVCVKCGIHATHFALERNYVQEGNDGPYHLNLWGKDENGTEVLFTQDHIVARGLGGEDKIHNVQTMCIFCNREKGLVEAKIAQAINQSVMKW